MTTVTTIPTPADFLPGALTSTDLNVCMQILRHLLDPPCFTVYQNSATTSIPNSTWTTLGYDAQLVLSSHGGHSTSVNNTRYTCPVDGVYELSGKVSFDNSTVGRRQTRWILNGSAIAASELVLPPASGAPMMPVASIRVRLVVGDYVEMQTSQDSGGTRTTSAGGTLASFMSGKWISR